MLTEKEREFNIKEEKEAFDRRLKSPTAISPFAGTSNIGRPLTEGLSDDMKRVNELRARRAAALDLPANNSLIVVPEGQK